MKRHFTRRRFLTTAGAAASVAIFGPSLFDGGKVSAAPLVRRDVGGMTASDKILVSYRKAIKAMKLLPTSNPLSWEYQAAIHGTLATPELTAWNTCEHDTLYFWSWHRMYLYWFERIIRKMSGDASWALPYWNWTSASQRQLPAPFRVSGSELFTSHRNDAFNDGTGELPDTDVTYANAFLYTNFASANSSIQGTPHGDIHVDIGGWMHDVETAGKDPIFYLHHSNIDRLWNLWLAQGGGRADPLSNSTWKNRASTFFDENGNKVSMTACDVLRAAEQLNYTYEGEPTQVKSFCFKFIKPNLVLQVIELIRWPGPPVELGPERVSFPFEIKQIKQRLPKFATSRTETLLLRIDGVEAERQPGVVWEVYVGLPANVAPDPRGQYYVGNLSLFGSGIRKTSGHGHKFQPARFAYPLNKVIQAALRTNEDNLSVTFVPHGLLINGKPSRPKAASPVRIGQVSLAVESQKRQ